MKKGYVYFRIFSLCQTEKPQSFETFFCLFVHQITEFQIQAIMEEKVRMTKKKQKDIKNESPSNVKFSCRSCSEPICTGDDIQIIENMHRVNVTPQFRYSLRFSS